jgi:hypothetical protein
MEKNAERFDKMPTVSKIQQSQSSLDVNKAFKREIAPKLLRQTFEPIK